MDTEGNHPTWPSYRGLPLRGRSIYQCPSDGSSPPWSRFTSIWPEGLKEGQKDLSISFPQFQFHKLISSQRPLTRIFREPLISCLTSLQRKEGFWIVYSKLLRLFLIIYLVLLMIPWLFKSDTMGNRAAGRSKHVNSTSSTCCRVCDSWSPLHKQLKQFKPIWVK